MEFQPKMDHCKHMILNLPTDGNPNMKTKLCRHWKRGQCTFGEACKFAHGTKELRGSIQVYKTSICRFWTLGACVAGNRCRHAHGEQELRIKYDKVQDIINTASTKVNNEDDDCPPGLDTSPLHTISTFILSDNQNHRSISSSIMSENATSPIALSPPNYVSGVSSLGVARSWNHLLRDSDKGMCRKLNTILVPIQVKQVEDNKSDTINNVDTTSNSAADKSPQSPSTIQ